MELIEIVYAKMKATEPEPEDYTIKDRFNSAKQAFKDLIQHKATRTAK